MVVCAVAHLDRNYGRKIIRKEKQEKLNNNKIHHGMVNFNNRENGRKENFFASRKTIRVTTVVVTLN